MQRFTGLLGLVVILAVAWLCSNRKREIKLRLIVWGIGLQLAFAVLVFVVRVFGGNRLPVRTPSAAYLLSLLAMLCLDISFSSFFWTSHDSVF